MLSRRTVAVLDMSACAAAVWPTMQDLADVLPPDIGLVIETCVDRGPDVSEPGIQHATHPYHGRCGVAPSLTCTIFIRVR